MNRAESHPHTKSSGLIWLVLAILTLPCAIQWMVTSVYSKNNVLQDMRFSRHAERAIQLDLSATTNALAFLKSNDQRAFNAYQQNTKELEQTFAQIQTSALGKEFATVLSQVRAKVDFKRQIEEVAFQNAHSQDAGAKNLVALLHGKNYQSTTAKVGKYLHVLIGMVEHRTSQSLEKTQIVTAAVQYSILALAFIIFMSWKQQSRYLQEEQRSIRHQQQLEKAKHVAEDANRMKSEFLANMSHEMRTPLTAIMGMAHLCQEENLSPKCLERISKIENAAGSLLKIVNDVLDLSKIEAGKLELETIPFHISDVLKQVETVVHLSVVEKQLTLKIESDDTCPPVIGDPFRLNQVLVNMVSNAIKFTEHGEIRVEVQQINDFPNDDTPVHGHCRLRFSIEDSGIGMGPDKLDKIFEMFSQADGSTTRKHGGTGLGLFICRRIVDSMDSRIDVESELGEGSRFYFDIDFQIADRLQRPPYDCTSQEQIRSQTEQQQIVRHSVENEKINALGETIECRKDISDQITRQVSHLDALVEAALQIKVDAVPAKVRQQISTLDKCLANFDSRSQDAFQDFAEMIHELDEVYDIKQLERSIRQFNFAKARKQLVDFCKSFDQLTN